jgi:hypothetical protein
MESFLDFAGRACFDAVRSDFDSSTSATAHPAIRAFRFGLGFSAGRRRFDRPFAFLGRLLSTRFCPGRPRSGRSCAGLDRLDDFRDRVRGDREAHPGAARLAATRACGVTGDL